MSRSITAITPKNLANKTIEDLIDNLTLQSLDVSGDVTVDGTVTIDGNLTVDSINSTSGTIIMNDDLNMNNNAINNISNIFGSQNFLVPRTFSGSRVIGSPLAVTLTERFIKVNDIVVYAAQFNDTFAIDDSFTGTFSFDLSGIPVELRPGTFAQRLQGTGYMVSDLPNVGAVYPLITRGSGGQILPNGTLRMRFDLLGTGTNPLTMRSFNISLLWPAVP